MKNIIISFSLWVVFLFVSCNEESVEPFDNLPEKSVVKKSALNYSRASFDSSFPHIESLNSISQAYSNHFSEELRNNLLDYMKYEVDKLGENVNQFDSILSVTACRSAGEFILPTYAERAKFENQEAWIFQVTYGLGNSVFGRCKCFVFNLANLDTLAYFGSR